VPQMDLGSRRNQTQEVSTNFNKRKPFSESVELTSDVRTSVWRKSDAYHGVIDLEKPSISGDAIEAIGCSGFGNPANQNGKSQDGSCCISPENTSLAESLQSCRDWNISRVSVGESLFNLASCANMFQNYLCKQVVVILYDLFFDCTCCSCICVYKFSL
jgi:hypothetical protein